MIIRYLVLAALTVAAILLIAGAAGMCTLAVVTGDDAWRVGAALSGVGAVYMIYEFRDYMNTH